MAALVGAVATVMLVTLSATPGASIATTLLASVAALLFVGITLEAWRLRGVGPIAVVGASAAVLLVIKPLYILSVGQFGPTLRQKFSIIPSDSLMITVAALILISSIMFYAGYRLSVRRVVILPIARAIRRSPWPVLAAAFFISVVTAMSLIQSQGGIARYFDALGLRTAVFNDKAWILVPLSCFKWCVVATIALKLMQSSGSRVGIRFWMLLIPAGIFDLISGGRAALLIDTALPLLLVLTAIGRPIRWRKIAAVGLVAVLFFLVSRALLRDRHLVEHRRDTSGQVVQQSLSNVGASSIGGLEAVPVDSLLYMLRKVPSELSFQNGTTIASVFTFPVPRAFWPDKPRGGNALFTSSFFPKFYGRSGVETSIGLLGDLYLNFGKVGIPIGVFLWGMLLGWLWNRARRGGGPARVAALAALARLLVALRGDIFHTVTSAGLSALTVYLLALILIRGSRRFVRHELTKTSLPADAPAIDVHRVPASV